MYLCRGLRPVYITILIKAYIALKSKKNTFIKYLTDVDPLFERGWVLHSVMFYGKNGQSAGNEQNLVILLGSSETIRYAPATLVAGWRDSPNIT